MVVIDGRPCSAETAAMFEQKVTHRPSAPTGTHLPARARGGREETTRSNGAKAGLAVGEKGEPPTGGQCELLNSSNATTGGTLKNDTRRTIYTRTPPARRLGSRGISHRRAHCFDACRSTAEMARSSSISAIQTDCSAAGTWSGRTGDCSSERCDRSPHTEIEDERGDDGIAESIISSPLTSYGVSSWLSRFGGALRPLLLQFKQRSAKPVAGLRVAPRREVANRYLPAAHQRCDARLTQAMSGLYIRNDV